MPTTESSGPRLLVVEDQPDLRRLIPRVLNARGYQVQAAGSAEEALEILLQWPEPDMLLTDLSLPYMDGTALAKRVGELSPGTCIGFMSGYDSVSEIEISEFGRIPLLDKPFTIDGLIGFVEKCLGQKSA
ncbi:response regulator [bacterium]|nr:MAG: response regulator [bacterium]